VYVDDHENRIVGRKGVLGQAILASGDTARG
jgi:hypothetical protein